MRRPPCRFIEFRCMTLPLGPTKTEVLVFGCTDGRESIAWNPHLGRHPVRVAGRRRRIAREVELPILERGDPEVQVRRDLRLGRAPPGTCAVSWVRGGLDWPERPRRVPRPL